jgi:hypothetical protein
MQARVNTASLKQLFMGAAFDDSAFLQDNNATGGADS